MRFQGDEFVAGDLIGFVCGECRIGYGGFPELTSIDWQDSFFYRLDDATGEFVELCDGSRAQIAESVSEALGAISDAGFNDCVIIHATDSAKAA